MKELLRSLSAELLKLKRTLALWMVLVAPALVVSLTFFIALDRGKPSSYAWTGYIQNSTALWSIFMLPLFVTLETSLLNNLEHTSRMWKQLFSLPVSRTSIVMSKFLMNFLLVGTSSLMFALLVFSSAKLLFLLRPEIMMPGFPIWKILLKAIPPFLASWLIIAIHSWISIRWQGFALSLGVGIGAVFFAVFATSARAGKWYPWLFPLNSILPERWLPAVVIGSIGGIIFAAFAIWTTVKRDVA